MGNCIRTAEVYRSTREARLSGKIPNQKIETSKKAYSRAKTLLDTRNQPHPHHPDTLEAPSIAKTAKWPPTVGRAR